jgi:uncharacterized short protein YbdD (DUF466 family)
MVRVFGKPTFNFTEQSSGEYMFEDDCLDVYLVAEVENTLHTHGVNHEDEYYESQKRLHPNFRKKKYPTVEEFWNSKEPARFKMWCNSHA